MADFIELKCQRCGGQLERKIEYGAEIYVCQSCGKTYEKNIKDVTDRLSELLNDQQLEFVANLKTQLWKEVHEEYISNREVERVCNEILRISSEDFYANFYLATCTKSKTALGDFLQNVDIDERYDDIPDMLEYLIKGLKPEWSMAVGNFIERAYKNSDIKLYNKFRTEFEKVNAEIEEGVFEPSLPRDVFIAYSSADMPEVERLTRALEDEGLMCFVAARNLRHGSGSIENYENAIHTAIDHCSVLVFVSSQKSRSLNCDAYKELNYIGSKRKDMPRVEYLVENYSGKAMERYFRQFFEGLEYCTSATDVAERVCSMLLSRMDLASAPESKKQTASEIDAQKIAEEAAKIMAQRLVEEQNSKADQNHISRETQEAEQINGVEEALKALPILGDYKDLGGGYITFGTYPQSKKANNVIIGEIYDKERGYYLGSDNNLYAEWRGDYYKVEPIKWQVLRHGYEMFVVADNILDAHRFAKSSNNYANSEIRAFINGEFYNRAFNDKQKAKIVTTLVDNSLSSTGERKNKNICNNTSEKVFLLSRKEAEQYLNSNDARKRVPTEYAVARGTQQYAGNNNSYKHNGSGCGSWWLRSPAYDESREACRIRGDGGIYWPYVITTLFGIVPALQIKL